MVKKSKNHSSKKASKIIHSKSVRVASKFEHTSHKETYSEGLLNVDKDQDKYDKMFEQKLAEQYKEFRSFKERDLQSKKFWGMIGIIVVIVLVALLLISYG